MANEDQVQRLINPWGGWNEWRKENPDIVPDLAGANLERQLLIGADLHHANLNNANLNECDLRKADLSHASVRNANIYFAHFNRANLTLTDFSGSIIINSHFPYAQFHATNLHAEIQNSDFQNAIFTAADLSEVRFHCCDFFGAKLAKISLANSLLENSLLSETDFDGSILEKADFSGSKLDRARLTNCNLRGARFRNASLVQTDFRGSNLLGSEVYGVSVWDVITDEATIQSNLMISSPEATISVDNIEVAQFVYLLLKREKIRNVIDTITSKAVLVLGRFTPERKVVLDALADELRGHNLLPIIFDFEGSVARDLTETIRILAGMSMFVIADVTNPKSSPLELQALVPDYQIPFVTIIQEGEQPFAMLDDLKKYHWVLQPVLSYQSINTLRKSFKKAILDRAWAKLYEIRNQQTEKMKLQSIEDFLQA